MIGKTVILILVSSRGMPNAELLAGFGLVFPDSDFFRVGWSLSFIGILRTEGVIMLGKFELHVGFPETAETEAMSFFSLLKNEGREGWSCSEVDSVHCESADVDPHNVPGTLRYLISKGFSERELASEEEVLSDAQWVISKLADMDIDDARLEIEYVFGYLTRRKNDDDGGASLRFSQPPEWSPEKLHLHDGSLMKTPNSEIHFILEMNEENQGSGRSVTAIDSEEASRILGAYGVEVQQTIEYRSQSMIERDRKDKRLICTAYYDSPSLAEKVARRLFVSTKLCEDFSERGYSLRLVLERILGCFQPTQKVRHSSSSEKSGMEHAVAQ